MSKNDNYFYFLEGDCEEHIFPFLKENYIKSGKKQKFNLIQDKISDTIIRTFKRNTIVVIVFDTDTNDGIKILEYNIKKLENVKAIKEIILIPQVKNFEDELTRATVIKQAKDFTKSMSRTDFKRDFLKVTNLKSKMEKHKFDICKFWSSNPTGLYQKFRNTAHKIKLKKEA